MTSSLARALQRRAAALRIVAVVLSGAASLCYQVAWTRRLVTITSATATSQALVLAVFMAGLGIGALFGGRIATRMARPILGYAAVELAAAALALLAAPMIDLAVALRPTLGAAQLVLVAAYFLVVTTLLGMSLPFLIEQAHADDPAGERGRAVSALYGCNTLGAAIGCLVAGFAAIEHLGLSRTVWLGAALALAAALLGAATARPRRAADDAVLLEAGAIERRWLAAAFAAGAVGLAVEVLWTRLFGLIVPNTVYAISQVLAAVLLGIALGAALAHRIARRAAGSGDPAAVATRAAGLVAGLGAALLAVVPHLLVALAGDADAQKELAAGRAAPPMLALLVLLVVVSALVAAVLPLLVIASRVGRGTRAFAALYAANTAGSVVGSLAAGFALLPALGARASGLLLELTLLALAGALLARQPRLRAVTAAVLASCVFLHLSHDVPRELYRARLPADARILEFREGVESNVMVTEDGRTGERNLWIGSIWVAGSRGPHAAFGHIPGLLVERPRRVLGIALGTGQTFAAVFAHGAERFDCVEIDAGVVELSRRWFGEANRGLLDDPRVHVHIEDGRAFMRETDEKFDLIVLEPLQSWTLGTTNLYSREFYAEARRILAPGGVVAQWIPFYGQDAAETRAMVRTGLDVFPHASLWLVLKDGVAVFSNDPFALSLPALERRIHARGFAADLLRFPAGSIGDLASYVLLGTRGLRAWTDGAEVITDDRPFLEFRAARAIGTANKFAAIVDTIRPFLDDLGAYQTDTLPSAVADLAAADRLRRAAFDLLTTPPDRHAERVARLEEVADPRSVRWRSLYKREVDAWLGTFPPGDPRAADVIARARRVLP